jgi:hypothetical protein
MRAWRISMSPSYTTNRSWLGPYLFASRLCDVNRTGMRESLIVASTRPLRSVPSWCRTTDGGEADHLRAQPGSYGILTFGSGSGHRLPANRHRISPCVVSRLAWLVSPAHFRNESDNSHGGLGVVAVCRIWRREVSSIQAGPAVLVMAGLAEAPRVRRWTHARADRPEPLAFPKDRCAFAAGRHARRQTLVSSGRPAWRAEKLVLCIDGRDAGGRSGNRDHVTRRLAALGASAARDRGSTPPGSPATNYAPEGLGG